ncbi:MBL fold metallo-hydrolase [uncultured Bacteroides sp.]|uniref:MBL fold metallo-hydrolase n=1 Tax=uncultured Bacteroides sp. TaxID=162156 RepID=UPI0025DA1543|nr:MBL fold metallo-hydrolase [uncultured Bacteroides sp.]
MEVTRIKNSLFSSNTYILSISDSQEVWLVDCGDVKPIFDWMEKNRKINVIGVLLTHSHFDHIYGLNNLLSKFPQTYVYIANQTGMNALYDIKQNGSKYAENPFVLASNVKICLLQNVEKNIVLWRGVRGNHYPAKGHSQDSVYFEFDNYLFTGDSFIPNIRTVSKLKGGNRDEAKQTVLDIKETFSGDTVICPGHEDMCYLKEVEIEKMY